MKVATVIASNGLFAKELLHVAEETIGHVSNVSAIDFHYGESLQELASRYREVLQKLDVRNGVLFLIASEQSCHQYIASQFVYEENNRKMVAGVNLPMLISLLLSENDETDPRLLALKAQQYGREGIHSVDTKN